MDSTFLQDCISIAAICSSCKSPKSKLELWQDDSKRAGLNAFLFMKCTLCKHVVYLNTSKSALDKSSN